MSRGGNTYFGTTRRGETFEWKEELSSSNRDVQKEAVKKVIAAMTLGKDVSGLFADVVKCVNTNNIELKKLVYLYVMNYARTKPDLAVLAVNTFVQDAQDPNPLVRALAVRTMGCIRVDQITEYLAEPLKRSLKDSDPYVRKTAAVAVAKLHDMDAELAVEQGFVDDLKNLLTDANPTVVANAVAALTEIGSDGTGLELTSAIVGKLLAALNECTEWGQVFILDALVTYNPVDAQEAQDICERVIPRLQHANAAVVLSAVKVIIKFMDKIRDDGVVQLMKHKMAPPLVTLLSSEPEIQYVALRNVALLIQKHPDVLQNDVKVFFCKYNDPIYVKMEKVEILIHLADEKNVEQILMEFKEYSTEVDIEFVRRSVRAIGHCAIKLERAAQRCVDVLLELIKTKVNYVVQEAIIVIKDVFRRYPNQYESVISTLCENLDTLDEPEAKAAMIWTIGEYAPRIENAGELLEQFLGTFQEEAPDVQLQLLTAIVKLFLHNPEDSQQMVERVLTLATEETDDPDLRDRGFMYWRLLSTDPEAARNVVLAEKPTISSAVTQLDKKLLTVLLENISSLSSVFHKPPEQFVPNYKPIVREEVDESDDDDEEEILEGEDVEVTEENVATGAQAPLDVLLDLGTPAKEPTPAAVEDATGGSSTLDSLFFSPVPQKPSVTVPKSLWLPASKGKGLVIRGCFLRQSDTKTPAIEFEFENALDKSVMGFAIQFDRNAYALSPMSRLNVPEPLLPGQKAVATLPLGFQGKLQSDQFSPYLRMATKFVVEGQTAVVYFQASVAMDALLKEDGKLESSVFIATWKSIPEEAEFSEKLEGVGSLTPAAVKERLEKRNVFLVAQRDVDGKTMMYFSSKLGSDSILCEISLSADGIHSSIRSSSSAHVRPFNYLLTTVLSEK